MTEQELVQLIRARDEAGAQELLQRFGALIRYVASPILKDPSDIEDCIQEVAARVWERIDSFDGSRGSFKSWLTTVTRNLALNMKRGRKDSGSYEELDDQTASQTPGPEETTVRNAQILALRKAVDSLPKDERLLIYRRFFYDQSIAQIAAETGMSQRAAEGRIYRIKAKLAEMLKEQRND